MTDDQPVRNGTFVTYAVVMGVLVTIIGGMSVWVFNLSQKVNDEQTNRINLNARTLAERGERITKLDGRIDVLDIRLRDLERICKK